MTGSLDAGAVLAVRRDALLGTAAAGSLVDGDILAGEGGEVAVHDPATGALLYSYREAGPRLAAKATAGAARAQREWLALTPSDRGRRLWALGQQIRDHAAALAELESAACGKPLRDTTAEVARVAEMAEYYAGWCDKIEGGTLPVPSGHFVYVRREAYGVVLAITPWNAPLFTAGWNAFPAIACGNAVVLKPSEFTPLSSLALGRLAIAAGLPAGLLQVMAGSGAGTGTALLEAEEVAKVTFVGGHAGGAAVAGACARRGIPCVLELGGKSANIVFADADLEAAVQGAQQAIFAGSGQSCVAGSRLLVQASIHDRFLAMLEQASGRIRLGAPLDPATEMGPVANARQFAHVQAMLAEGARDGAQQRGGGRPADLPQGGYWLAPTILAGLDAHSRPVREEIFGPVVAAQRFEDEAEAITLANATRVGLAGAAWTRDLGRAHRVAAAVRAGTFWVNGYRTINVMVPFGGFGASGHGRSSGQEALSEYTQPKAVWVETREQPALGFGHRPTP